MLIPKEPCEKPRNVPPIARMRHGMTRRELWDALQSWERAECFAPFSDDLEILRDALTKGAKEPAAKRAEQADPTELPAYIEAAGDVIVERPDGSRYRGFVDAISFEKDKTIRPPGGVPVTTLGAVFVRLFLTRPFV
jgi:hypothetical protein